MYSNTNEWTHLNINICLITNLADKYENIFKNIAEIAITKILENYNNLDQVMNTQLSQLCGNVYC